MNKFRSFTTEDDVFAYPMQEMAMGKSDSSLPLPITHPMANLLTLLERNAVRARALNWLLFDGLKQAIVGREKLCAVVNKALKGQLDAGVARGPARHAPTPTSRIAIGEVSDVNAATGRDTPDVTSPDYMVQPCDLFSPKAYERDPRLGELDIDGLSISDYYQKHYEPRLMTIDASPGEPVDIDLVKMREILIHKGLEPFTYGGFHGYLQYVEKGDALKPHEKNFHDPNDQWGHDLTLDTSEHPDGENVIPYKDSNVPTLHLKGGSVNKSGARSALMIAKMGDTFARVAKRLENSDDISDINPQLVQHISGVLNLEKQIQKVEVGIGEKGQGRGQAADQLGFERSQNAQNNFCEIPPEFDENNLQLAFSLFKKGLSEPLKAKESDIKVGDKITPRFTDLAKFGAEWNGEGPEPDGWHRFTDDGKVIIKLSRQDQDAIYRYMIADPMQAHGGIYVRPDWSQIPELRDRIHPDAGRFAFSTILNAGKKSDPAIMNDFKRVLYNFKDIDTSSYMKKKPLKSVEIKDPNNPGFDPVLSKLWDAGYRWELRNDYERKEQKPQWSKFGNGILALGSSRYKVESETNIVNGQQQTKFFLKIPTKADGTPIKLPDHGLPGRSILTGGMFATGGKGGHVKAQPAGPETYKQLLAKLMSGEMGEPAVSAPADLACVQEAIKGAKYNFGSYKGYSVEFNYNELLSWALEGLQAYSGKSAWQVGFLSEEEVEHELRWGIEKRIDLATEKGWGISAIMHMMGVEDHNDQAETIEDIIQMKLEDPIIDLNVLPKNKADAFKENSYQARKRLIQGYLMNMMTKANDAKSKEKQAGQLAGKDGGNGDEILDAGQKPAYRGDWEAGKDRLKILDPQAIQPNANSVDTVEDEPSERPIATFKQGRKQSLIKPIYVNHDFDKSKFIDGNKLKAKEKQQVQLVANPKIATKTKKHNLLPMNANSLATYGISISAPDPVSAPVTAKTPAKKLMLPMNHQSLMAHGIYLSKPETAPVVPAPIAARDIPAQTEEPVKSSNKKLLPFNSEELRKAINGKF